MNSIEWRCAFIDDTPIPPVGTIARYAGPCQFCLPAITMYSQRSPHHFLALQLSSLKQCALPSLLPNETKPQVAKHKKIQRCPPASIRSPSIPDRPRALLSPLEIKRTLILQPPPVIRHTANLLPVVIRNRVRHGRGRRINAVLLDAVVKLTLFLLTRQ